MGLSNRDKDSTAAALLSTGAEELYSRPHLLLTGDSRRRRSRPGLAAVAAESLRQQAILVRR